MRLARADGSYTARAEHGAAHVDRARQDGKGAYDLPIEDADAQTDFIQPFMLRNPFKVVFKCFFLPRSFRPFFCSDLFFACLLSVLFDVGGCFPLYMCVSYIYDVLYWSIRVFIYKSVGPIWYLLVNFCRV